MRELLVLLVGVFILQASSQTLPCQVTGGTSCPTMICPNTAVNYTCNVGSSAGNTNWNVPSVGGCSGSTLVLAQGPPGIGLSCLTSSSSGTCGPFTVTNTPPLTNNNTYCLTSTLSVTVTSAMNGLVVSCSNYLPISPFTTTPVGNAAISVVVPPSAPNITSLISMYSDRLTVTWTSVPTAISYSVSINDSVNTLVPIPSTGASRYMWIFTGLTNNTVYTVSVVAINCAGSSSLATLSGRTSNEPPAPTTTSPTPTPASTTKSPSTDSIAIGVGIGVGVGVPVLLALILVIVGVVYCTTRGGNKSLKIRNEESSLDGSHPPPSKPPRVKNSSPPAAEARKPAAKPSGDGLVYADVNTAKGSGNKRNAPPPANDGVTYSGVKH